MTIFAGRTRRLWWCLVVFIPHAERLEILLSGILSYYCMGLDFSNFLFFGEDLLFCGDFGDIRDFCCYASLKVRYSSFFLSLSLDKSIIVPFVSAIRLGMQSNTLRLFFPANNARFRGMHAIYFCQYCSPFSIRSC